MRYKFSRVDCRYGAPMGRANLLPDRNMPATWHLQRVRFVDGGAARAAAKAAVRALAGQAVRFYR